MVNTLNHQELREHLHIAYDTKTPLFVWGGVGIGKSQTIKDVARDIAKSKKLEFTENANEKGKFGFLDVRISQLEPSDLRGLPIQDVKEGTTKWLFPNWLPREEDSQGIIFFDELNLSPPSIQASCFKEDTLISGKEYKKIKDLNINDEVIDMNGNLQKVTELKSRKYSDKMYQIKGRNFMPIEATKEHPFYVIKSYQKGNKKWNKKEKVSKPIWLQAEDLKKGYYIGIPKLVPTFEENSLLINKQKSVETKIEITPKFAKFLGYYVGDGYYSNSRIGIALNSTEKRYQKDVADLIEKIFGKKALFKGYSTSCIDVGFCNKDLGLLLKRLCGENVYEKHIPYEILFNKDIEILRQFLIGYFNADGHIYNQNNKKCFVGFSTVSKKLALQLQQAFTRFDLLVSISTQEERTIKIHGKKTKCRESYRIQSSQKAIFDLLEVKQKNIVQRKTEHFFESQGILWAKIDDIKIEEYNGMVYNCEVENTHSYLAHNYIVHNCYQLILDRRLGDYKLPKGWVIVSAGNRMEDKCNVFDMSSALCNRFIHATLDIPSVEKWSDWAIKNEVDSQIISFLNFKSDSLYKIGDKNKDKAFPTPRSWAFCSRLIKGRNNMKVVEQLVSSSVGEGTAKEFIAFLRLQTKIDLDKIFKEPKQVEKITEVDLRYVLIGTIAEKYRADKKLFEKILPLCDYLQAEYSILLLRFLKNTDETHFRKSITSSKKGTELLKSYADILS